ncbi:MAG: ACT domain-containing protein, partial [Phycisphaerales bacterium]|nr:ACT domain-containing protein [Phycisphaerales bacterium]
RALACDMRVIGYDPLVGSAAVLDGAVRLVNDVDELLTASDCVTLHAKITENTKGMLNAERIGRMKRSAVVVNCARGELIDEAALAAALNEGRLAGAAVDVYSQEPPKGNPLLTAKNVVLSPHLGASTEEAQVAVSVEAADALLDYLVRGEIRSAVNVVGLPAQFNERDRAYLDLCMRMGSILSPWCAKGIERLQVTTRGEGIDQLCRTLARQCSVSLLTPHIGVRLNLVNAASITRERGIQVDAVAHAATRNYAETVTLVIETRDGRHEIEGTVFVDGRPRVLAIDGYRMEMAPERALVLIFNDDRPGVIGSVGQLFGDAGINIADMTLSRRDRTALMLLKLDQAPGDAVLKQLVALDAIQSVQSVLLVPLEKMDR